MITVVRTSQGSTCLVVGSCRLSAPNARVFSCARPSNTTPSAAANALQVPGHHGVLAVPLLDGHQRHALHERERVNGSHERFADAGASAKTHSR